MLGGAFVAGLIVNEGRIAEAIGAVLGIFLVAAILTAIPLVFYDLIRKPMTKFQKMMTFTVAYGLVTLPSLLVACR